MYPANNFKIGTAQLLGCAGGHDERRALVLSSLDLITENVYLGISGGVVKRGRKIDMKIEKKLFGNKSFLFFDFFFNGDLIRTTTPPAGSAGSRGGGRRGRQGENGRHSNVRGIAFGAGACALCRGVGGAVRRQPAYADAPSCISRFSPPAVVRVSSS